MSQILKNFILFLFSCFLIIRPAYSVNITGANTINSDSTTQQVYNADDTSLTITNSSTLSRTGQAPVNINEKDDGTLTINSGSSITATSHNTVQGKDQDGLTVTNSGTISSGGSKAINLLNAQNSTITNNSGGIIKSNTNTVTLTENSGTGNNVTINNSGQIFSEAVSSGTTNNNAVKSEDDTNNMTLTNNAGGHIYNNNSSATALQQATVFIAAEDTATLTNSGTIENKAGPENWAIGLAGTGVTVTLKDKGKVIGKINSGGSGGHTIKLQHGAGQGYYYDITGSGSYTLQDLDGNPVVKGSAGSVGQGGNEMVDEELGYKSLSMRNSLARYHQSDEYLEREKGWGEITTSFLKREGDKNTLALDNEKIGIGANIFEPISNNKTLIFSFETSLQNISANHDIDKFSFLTGINFDEIEISDEINSKIYVLGGASFNKSERNILTNTTSTGLLDISDEYMSYEILIGNKLNFNNLLPDLSFNFGYSHTPSHEESKYYKWEERDVYNGSVALSNENQILKDKKKNLYFSWIADARTVIDDNVQVFYVNGTKGSYSQNNDLKTEFSLSAGLNFDYNFNNNNKFSIALEGLQTSQDTSGVQANLKYTNKF